MLKPVPDADLLSGKYGDIGGLVMIKRDMARARLAGSPGARMDGFYRTDAEQIEWQMASAEIYEGIDYVPQVMAMRTGAQGKELSISRKQLAAAKTHSMTLATMQDCLQDSAALNSSIQLQRRSQSQELRSRRKLSISPSKEVD